MRFNVDYREDATGLMKGGKCYYLIGRVEFTQEEKAIVQQRGLYDHPITVPSGDVPTSKTKYVGAGFIKVFGVIIAPIGLLSYCAGSLSGGSNGSTTGGVIMLIIGAACFGWGKWVDWETNRIIQNPDQTLSPRRLLTNPEFKVYAPDMQVAKGFEVMVREELSRFAQFLRDSASVPEKTGYEL